MRYVYLNSSNLFSKIRRVSNPLLVLSCSYESKNPRQRSESPLSHFSPVRLRSELATTTPVFSILKENKPDFTDVQTCRFHGNLTKKRTEGTSEIQNLSKSRLQGTNQRRYALSMIKCIIPERFGHSGIGSITEYSLTRSSSTS